MNVCKVRYIVGDVPHYEGPAIWEEHPTWIPVAPFQAHCPNKPWLERTQLPVVLGFGLIIHKCQGLTFRTHVV